MNAPEMVTVAKAGYEHLREQVTTLRARCGHLMVDASRREQAARDEAWNCAAHGKRILYLERLAWWHWAASGHAEQQRQAIVTALILLERDELAHRTEPVPVDVLIRWVRKMINAQGKVRKRPADWPPLGDYLSGEGGFGPPAAMKAEIAEALGLGGALFPAGDAA